MSVPQSGLHFCAESTAEKKEVEYGGESGIFCEAKVCKALFLSPGSIFDLGFLSYNPLLSHIYLFTMATYFAPIDRQIETKGEDGQPNRVYRVLEQQIR